MAKIITPRLSGRQRKFIKYYTGRNPDLHGNATRSYKAAYGLTDTRSASVCGSKLMKRPLVKALIAKAIARMDEETIVDAGFVLKQSKRLYDRAMGDEPVPGVPVIAIDPRTGDEVVTVPERYDYDPATARQALQLMGQHKDVQAFTQTVEHNHTHMLEQRLAARSKVIEGRAGQIGDGPYLGGDPQQPAHLEHDPSPVAGALDGAGDVSSKAQPGKAHVDLPAGHTSVGTPIAGGQTDSEPAP